MHYKLTGIKAKIERSKEHIHNLDWCIRTLRNLDPHSVLVEIDPQTGEKRHKFFALPIPHRIPIMIGEALYQLRSALDHLACRLVVANHGADIEKTAFPIYNCPAKYKSESPRQVKGIHPDAERALESVQPYQTGYSRLGLIQDLNNIDKHRLVFQCAHVPDRIEITGFENPARLTVPEEIVAKLREPTWFEDGAIILRLASEDEYYLDFTTAITLAYPAILQGEPILEFLAQSADFVENLIERFEPFL